jgi:glycosyltransferase involved in cell wall biosynthesis
LTVEEIDRLSRGRSVRELQVIFLGTGRSDLNRDKGLDDLLSVLPDLWRSHPQSRWILAGLPEPEAIYEALKKTGVDPDGLTPRVRCLGIVDAETKEMLLMESSILALPSYFENMPNTLLEAMAAELGVVATSVGAIPEMLGNDGGILVNPGDLRALSDGLGKLLASPQLLEAQGKRNQEVLRRHYTMEAVEADLEVVYREVGDGRVSSLDNVNADIQEAVRPKTSPAVVSKGHPVVRP